MKLNIDNPDVNLDPKTVEMHNAFWDYFSSVVDSSSVSVAWAMLSWWQWPDRIDKQEWIWNLNTLIEASAEILKTAISYKEYLQNFWDYIKQSANSENFALLEEFSEVFKERFWIEFPFDKKEAKMIRAIHGTSFFITEDLVKAYEENSWTHLSDNKKLIIWKWVSRALNDLFDALKYWTKWVELDLNKIKLSIVSDFYSIIPNDLSNDSVLEVTVYKKILKCWGLPTSLH